MYGYAFTCNVQGYEFMYNMYGHAFTCNVQQRIFVRFILHSYLGSCLCGILNLSFRLVLGLSGPVVGVPLLPAHATPCGLGGSHGDYWVRKVMMIKDYVIFTRRMS